LLSEDALRQKGYFDSKKVGNLITKCQRQEGHLVSERENMALVGILSTQLLDHLFLQSFPPTPIREPKDVLVFSPEQS
jgi:asparagine synthase (glutamine-hydrolysing)